MSEGTGDEETSRHVRRAINGDDESLAWLVERFSGVLNAQARYRMGEALQRFYDPADVVSDVWFVALPRLGDLDSSARFTPVLLRFLTTTLIHRVNHLVRLRLRSGRTEEALDHLRKSDQNLAGDRARGVVSSVLRRENRRIVHDILDELTDEDREVIVLRFIEQRPADEVADLLGITRDYVYVRQQRALQRIRNRIPGTLLEALLEDSI